MNIKRNLATIAVLASGLAAGQNTKGFSERYPHYRIQCSDVIEVQYRYTPELNATVTVQPDGYIALQQIGDVHVAGETLEGVAREIEKVASKRLNNPEVSIVLKDFVKPHFVVAGQVERPGTYDLRGDVTTMQAIAMGGGFKDSAKHSHVMLIRRVDQEWAEVKVIDLKHMMQSGQMNEDMLLRPDDILLVPQNNVSRMERYVRWASLAATGLAIARP